MGVIGRDSLGSAVMMRELSDDLIKLGSDKTFVGPHQGRCSPNDRHSLLPWAGPCIIIIHCSDLAGARRKFSFSFASRTTKRAQAKQNSGPACTSTVRATG